MTAIETTVVYEGRQFPVSFASDDSIDVVRQRLGAVIDRFPDRLFLQVEVTLPAGYYKDPRRWESLFFRLAHRGQSMMTSAKLMEIYTKGEIRTGVSRDDWDGAALRELRSRPGPFSETFILGVDESQSLVLPIPPDATIAAEVPSARVPLAEHARIFSSVHPHPVVRFHATEIPETADRSIKDVYAPLLRTGTPDRLNPETVQVNQTQFEMWKKLHTLDSPEPTSVGITRARWQIPWVRTQWPDAIRARLEEIMYGMTVSADVPYIGLFMNRDYGMQHKFWAEDKTPKIDMQMWSSWLQTTRPQRNRPTLLLYRGKDRSNFDRIAITSAGMAVSAYRSGQKSSLTSIKKDLSEWIDMLDALEPFVDKEDYDEWELQDVSAELTYKTPMEDPDLRRLPCVSGVFLQAHPVYRLLRADKTDRTLSDIEVGILQILRRDIATTPEQLAESLGIDVDLAGQKLDDLRDRVEQDPSILTQELDIMPKIEFSGSKAILQHANDLDRITTYTNILRHVLLGTGRELAAVCPARMETVAPITAVATTVPTREEEIAAEEVEGDLADFLEQMGSARKTGPTNPLFNYYTTRLRKVSPDTFDTPYSKKCEPSRQVLMMTPEEQEKWRGTPYDPNAYPESEILKTPGGVTICPDYWCMKDEIPLRKEQLRDGTCPVCGGKIRDPKSTESVNSAPVIARDTDYKYPRFLKDIVSSKNGQGMPCCYKQAKATQVLAAPADSPTDPFYILGELKRLPPQRLAYLPEELAKRLRLNIGNYKSFRADNSRLKDRAQGVFRVGMGRPSKTIASILNVDIPAPRDAISKLFQCQFVRTWREPRDDDGTFDAALVPYMPDAQARGRMARLMAGVDAAYAAGGLTQIQELEYVSLVAGLPVYRIDMINYSVSCGLWTQYFAQGRNAIAVLEMDGSFDLLAYATHRGDTIWQANLYAPPFVENTVRILRQADAKACATPFPSMQDAIGASMRIGILKDTPFVIDPVGFAQAIWAPQRYIIPMRPDMVAETTARRIDYADMGDDQLPAYDSERQALEIAASVNPQFAWKRDIFDVRGRRVEIETQSGLRVPVVPEEGLAPEEPEEILQTLRQGRERDLVQGTENVADVKRASEISYTSEVTDFLLYTLSRDLQTDTYMPLRRALENMDRTTLRPLLEQWYSNVATEMSVESPVVFVKKVRTPCGQFKSEQKCNGVCGWSRGVCKVRIDNKQTQRAEFMESNPTGTRSLIFKRVFEILVTNAKKRAVVLDGRASPFFSTILYLELPHERFLTDAQIKWEKTATSE